TKRVKTKNFNVPFSVDTSLLADGQHTLELEAIDSSYNRNRTEIAYIFAVDNSPLHAAFVSSDYVVDQGKTLHLKIQANKKLATAEIKFLATIYKFHQESEDSTLYECFIPINCEER